MSMSASLCTSNTRHRCIYKCRLILHGFSTFQALREILFRTFYTNSTLCISLMYVCIYIYIYIYIYTYIHTYIHTMYTYTYSMYMYAMYMYTFYIIPLHIFIDFLLYRYNFWYMYNMCVRDRFHGGCVRALK